MKIETAIEATVATNVPTGDVTKMSINLEGVPHLMNILTNLYSNPRLAVIREYFCNAVDAHVAVGNTAPVEVTLPSWDSPVYMVCDHGIGMSADDIRNIYAQYGASTKRESNDQIGAFGLGCKSALTITNQFTVTSVKDNWKTTALISKTETGINSINIIAHSETEDANGTTVKIPVNDINAFVREAESFFQYADEGVVLVDGVDPSGHLGTLREIEVASTGESTYLGENTSYNREFVVVMGNVPYFLTHNDLSSAISDPVIYRALSVSSMYFRAGIGDVDLTPNREGLRLTDKTNEFINKQMTGTYETIRNMALEEMDAITDRAKCFDVLSKWRRYGFTLSWKGETVPDRISSADPIKFLSRETEGYGSYTDNTTSIKPAGRGTIITDLAAYDFAKVSRHLLAYTRSLGLVSADYYITNDTTLHANKWLTENSNFSFTTSDVIIEAAKEQRKIERANNASSASTKPSKIEYPVLDMSTEKITMVPYTDIPDDVAYMAKETFYGSNYALELVSMASDASFTSWSARLHTLLGRLTDAKHIAFVGKQRTANAFLSRVKSAYDLGDDVKKAYEKLDKLQSNPKVIKEHALSDRSDVHSFRYLGLHKKEVIAKLDDTDLRIALSTTSDGESPEMAEVKTLRNTLTMFKLPGVEFPEIADAEGTTKMSDRYPLIDALGYNSKSFTDEIVIYLNAVYQTKISGLAVSAEA